MKDDYLNEYLGQFVLLEIILDEETSKVHEGILLDFDKTHFHVSFDGGESVSMLFPRKHTRIALTEDQSVVDYVSFYEKIDDINLRRLEDGIRVLEETGIEQ